MSANYFHRNKSFANFFWFSQPQFAFARKFPQNHTKSLFNYSFLFVVSRSSSTLCSALDLLCFYYSPIWWIIKKCFPFSVDTLAKSSFPRLTLDDTLRQSSSPYDNLYTENGHWKGDSASCHVDAVRFQWEIFLSKAIFIHKSTRESKQVGVGSPGRNQNNVLACQGWDLRMTETLFILFSVFRKQLSRYPWRTFLLSLIETHGKLWMG